MKQVNFSHEGGFPLEQETLERLQTAYRSELFEALKSHLSIKTNENYIVAHATSEKQGWAIIHQEEKDTEGKLKLQGILYPIQKGTKTNYLKATRTGTNLTYGTGLSQTAYFDYEAAYISQHDFNIGIPLNDDALAVYYYDLNKFTTVKDLKAIEAITDAIDVKIATIKTNITKIEGDINVINDSYLPLKGYKAMEGDLNLGIHKLSRLDTKENGVATVRAADFRLGSIDRKGLLHPEAPTGRALVDSSDQTSTNLTLNYQSDWDNTYIGGKVHLNNLNTSSSTGSFLVLDNSNQVTKNNTVIDSLINRITNLENKLATTLPIGMIAIWGKSAPFPEGWEEYVPLRGRMPVGYDFTQTEFNPMGRPGGSKSKKLIEAEMPAHTHDGHVVQASGDWKAGGHNSSPNCTSTTGKTLPAGSGEAFSILNPYIVVHFIQYTGRSLSTIALTTPPNLIAQKVGATFVDLSWKLTYNGAGITNYLVYKNDILFATINNTPFYTVNGLSRSSSYDFCVRAQDAAGNISGASNTIRVKTNLL